MACISTDAGFRFQVSLQKKICDPEVHLHIYIYVCVCIYNIYIYNCGCVRGLSRTQMWLAGQSPELPASHVTHEVGLVFLFSGGDGRL